MRLAVASLLSSNVLACVGDATALLRDVASAGRQCSTLQVVRIACLAAQVERDAAGVHAPSHTAPSPEHDASERAVLAGGVNWNAAELTPARVLVLVRCYHLDNSGVSTSGLTPG